MQSLRLIFNVLWSPTETMLLISKSPRVLAPMLFLAVFSCISGAVVLARVGTSEVAMRSIQRSLGLTTFTDDVRAEVAKSRAYARLNSPAGAMSFLATKFVDPLVPVLAVSLIFFLIFSVLGRDAGFKAFLSITAFAFIPTILRHLATILMVFVAPSAIRPDEPYSLSPAAFLDRSKVSPVVFAATSTIDVALIWTIVLLVIGYGFVARESVSKVARASAVGAMVLVYVVSRLTVAAMYGL